MLFTISSCVPLRKPNLESFDIWVTVLTCPSHPSFLCVVPIAHIASTKSLQDLQRLWLTVCCCCLWAFALDGPGDPH